MRRLLFNLLIPCAAIALIALATFRFPGPGPISIPTPTVDASDHDDGEISLKGRALNLTDLYVFREGEQTGVGADNSNMIFIMCLNPRSVAREPYYFATNTRYQFHVNARTTGVGSPTSVSDHFIFRFTFAAATAHNGAQTMTCEIVRNGTAATGVRTPTGTISTTPLTFSAAGDQENDTVSNTHNFTAHGTTFTVFAGLREDPFFFDVTRFFQVRAGAATQGPAVGFLAAAAATDFTAGYNVNAIVLRVPLTFLQSINAAHTAFDTWTTISVLQ